MTSTLTSTTGSTPTIACDADLAEYYEAMEQAYGRGQDDLIPGTFQLKRNLANDYLIDRQVQKTQTFTGIDGINTQDFALQEGMGRVPAWARSSIAPRSISAHRIARSSMMRRMLLEAIDNASQRGAASAGRRSGAAIAACARMKASCRPAPIGARLSAASLRRNGRLGLFFGWAE